MSRAANTARITRQQPFKAVNVTLESLLLGRPQAQSAREALEKDHLYNGRFAPFDTFAPEFRGILSVSIIFRKPRIAYGVELFQAGDVAFRNLLFELSHDPLNIVDALAIFNGVLIPSLKGLVVISQR